MSRKEVKPEFYSRELELEKSAGEMKRRTYCGPTVLLLLTGLPYERLRGEINRRRNKISRNKSKLWTPVKGLGQNTMHYMLEKHGMKPKREKLKGITLKTFCDDRAHIKKKFVVISGNHYLILSEGKVHDTFQVEGAPFDSHPFAKTRMSEFWELDHDAPLCIEHTLQVRYTAAPKKEKPKADLKDFVSERHDKAAASLAKWEKKARLAKTKIAKYKRQVKYYEARKNKNDPR